METEEKKAPARKTRKKAPAAKAEKPAEEATVEVGDFQGLNVREAKSLESEIVGSISNHGSVMAYPEEDGWRELADGGFVVAKYLA